MVKTMEKKNGLGIVMPLIALMGLVAGIIGNLYLLSFEESAPYLQIAAVFIILAMIAALVYVFGGFKKRGAKYYSLFIYLFALSEFVSIIFAASIAEEDTSKSLVGVILRVALFGILLVLASAKDLGKTKTYTLGIILLVTDLVMFIASLVMNFTGNGSSTGVIFAIRTGSNLFLSFSLLVMMIEKYADKASRGSK